MNNFQYLHNFLGIFVLHCSTEYKEYANSYTRAKFDTIRAYQADPVSFTASS